MKTPTPVHMHMNGRLALKRGPAKITADTKIGYQDLENLGVVLHAMDSVLTGPPTTNGILPGYMLQTWLPGTLRVVT